MINNLFLSLKNIIILTLELISMKYIDKNDIQIFYCDDLL